MKQSRNHEDITDTPLGNYISNKKRTLIHSDQREFADYFQSLIELHNIYILNAGGEIKRRIIRINDNSFFDEYYSKYKQLYEPKFYFVWYKTLWRRRMNKRKKSDPQWRKKIYGYVKKRDGNKCVKCGSKHYLTIDHIAPYSISGDDTIYNFATLCKKCNQRKSSKVDDGFVTKYLLKEK